MLGVDFVHPEQQFTQARPYDFVPVRPGFGQQADLVLRSCADVVPKPDDHVAADHGYGMVQGLHHGLHPVVLIQKAEVVHGGARRGQHALVLIGHHVMKQGNGVGGDASEQAREDISQPSSDGEFLTGVKAMNHLESPLSVAFDQPSKAGAHVGGDFRFRIGRSPEQDVNEAQGFDERRALKQELNPTDEQETAVNVTFFQARQDPRCGFSTGGVGLHLCRSRHHGMWVPAHVLRTDVRLRVPRPWPLCQSDGFEQVVSFVDRLAVCRLSQAVQQTHCEPPAVGVGRLSVEGLGQPRGGQAVDDAPSDVVHPLCQPTPMHFVGVIGQAHAVGHDEVDDLVQVALEGPSVRLQQRERRSGYVGRCVRHQRWEIWVDQRRGRERPCQRATLEGLGHHRGRVFKHGLEQRCLGPLHSVASASGDMKRMG